MSVMLVLLPELDGSNYALMWANAATSRRTNYSFEGKTWTIVARTDFPEGNRHPSVQFLKGRQIVLWVQR
jgi:hypothetical protein